MTEERTINRADPHTAPPEGQWIGRVEGDPQNRAWAQRSVERVIDSMNEALGPVPDAAYHILERP